MTKDYYKTLGVEKNATQDEIKTAYKKLAKKYHPDINKEANASDKFKEINEAAAILGDQQKRQQYDQFGTAGQNFSGFDHRDFAGNFNFDDIFENIFSGFGFGGQKRQRPGRDLATEIDITLEEASTGTTKEIHMQRTIACTECEGKGGTNFVDCDTCQGQGTVRHAKRTPFGVFATTTSCSKCQGTGQKPEKICEECDGEGRIITNEPLKIKVPAGIHDTMKLRLEGEGEAGQQGAEPGDLYVIVHVLEDERFEREENDLVTERTINMVTACVGGEINVETLHGQKTIKIEPGTQPGQEIKLKGEGMPELQSTRKGDFRIKINIEIPKKLNKKQTELLKDFEKEGGKKWGLF